jgi:malate synthase
MAEYISKNNLQITKCLYDLVNQQILPGTEIAENSFWQSLEGIFERFTPVNESLLEKRDSLQKQIDQWHQNNPGKPDFPSYKRFLQEIGYLEEAGEDFEITSSNVDSEIALQAGPQLVVPIMNARYALNAANARWGSLYDALYGTDIIDEQGGAEKGQGYNPVRGAKVIAYARNLLNQHFPLESGSYNELSGFSIKSGQLSIQLQNGTTVLKSMTQFIGYKGDADSPTAVLLKNNGNHIEIQIDASHPIGKTDPAHIKDLLVESALTTIMDCEDSVAAVDGEDKALAYSNWLGLMKGDLTEEVKKGDKTIVRAMNEDRSYKAADGTELTLHGRSLLFVRNVGHLMRTPAVLYKGEQVFEGLLDGMLTSLAAIHNLKGNTTRKNTRTGSVYIVKPKMHGPEEVAMTNDLFNAIEDELNLERFTLKVGVMDEERRTSVNLKACIRAVKDRVVFINTGFLDRTGDEIHTSMLAGPFAPKAELKNMTWIKAYENSNVDIGLACGLKGKAQIGKGMWPIPDQMANMMEAKLGHPKAGANTAWVPSPTAATLHALHYQQVSVAEIQEQIKARTAANVDDILQIPLLDDTESESLTAEIIQKELDNNAQGILGYVVRWVDQGVGCSKVPDINNVGLMEDRATLRISSQHIANWLYHGICTEEQVMETMKRMAAVVDNQNQDDPLYVNMADDFEGSIAFNAACELVLKGTEQPSGYTEPVLHARRLQLKAKLAS